MLYNILKAKLTKNSSVNIDRNLVSVCFFVNGGRFVLQRFTSSVQESVVFNVKKAKLYKERSDTGEVIIFIRKV